MTFKELKEKDQNALNDELNGKRRHLFDLRTQAVTQKLENPSQLKATRRDIARILTLQTQRQTEQKSK
ncbi:MAG TPA: 50S ribosomal protein L29 [Tepidisphaeraceae bacterium]|jgi:large subunit ribosomal protein L29